jgi:hypothetical protein
MFCETEFVVDEDTTYKVGDVLEMTNLGGGFAACTVLGFTKPDKYDDTYMKVARPMAYVLNAGTTSPSVVMSSETFEVHTNKLDGFVRRNQGFVLGSK